MTRRTQAVPPTPGRGPTAREPQVAGSSAANANARTLLMHAHELSQSAKNEAQFSNVIDACRQTLAAGPDEGLADYAAKLTSWALNRRGQIRSDEFRDEEALADFETAVRLDPSRWRAVHNRAVLLAQRGQFERAFDDFNYTIQLNPMFAKAYSNRAALFVHAGDMQSALRDYGRATSLDDSLAIAQRGSAKVCHLLGNLDRAITHYDIAVELDPNDPYTYVRRAELLIDMGHYAEADIDYDHAMQLDPQMAEAYRGSAWLLATCPDRRVRHGELAIERAERAIELRQDDDPHYFDTLAAAQASVGEFRDAAKSGNRAVALSTDTDRTAYEQRLQLYEDFQPYRTAPVQNVQQASYEQ